MASPRPRLAPVITAVRPDRSIVIATCIPPCGKMIPLALHVFLLVT
jgi:hypothetical protein